MTHSRKGALRKLTVRMGSFVLFVLACSCDYEPHETYVKPIPEPDLSNLFIDLSNHPNDTLYLFGKTGFGYNAFLNGRQRYGAYVYMDGFQILTLQSNDTAFTIDASQYEEGRHILTLEIYGSAGTGSLADIAGAEQLILTREWVTYIDNSVPEGVDFTTVGVDDGSMEINWKRYPTFNFSAYVLEKQYWHKGYKVYSTCWKKEFTDKDDTSFTDSTYLGGLVRYKLSVRAGSLYSTAAMEDFEYVYDPALQFEWIDKEQVRVTWRKPDIAIGFNSYEAGLGYSNLTTITSISDTAVIVKPGISFGQSTSFALKVHTNGNPCEGAWPVYVDIKLGNEFAGFTGTKIVYSTETDQYYTREYTDNEYKLIRIDGTRGTVDQTTVMDGEFSLAPNGGYLYITYDNVLRQLDPMTLEVVRSHNLYDLGGAYASIAGNFSVSDNHRISIATYDSNYVVQMPDFKVLYRAKKDFNMGMSASGNSVVSNGKLWTWNGTAYIEKHTFADAFRPTFRDDETLIKTYYGDKISIQDLTTYQERSITLQPNPDVIVYDPVSDLIGYAQESSYYDRTTTFHLIDMHANPVKQFTVAQLDNHRGQHIVLINNRILCSLGSSIPLSYYYP